MRVLFAHGAGAPSSSPWMRGWTERLSTLGRVHPFDYPYAAAGKKRPDPLPKLLEAHRNALGALREAPNGPLVLAGKSMGSRVGCHLALEAPEVAALVCFGYPLVSPGKKRTRRDAVLKALRTPILFVQGTRDRLCPLDELEGVRAEMEAPSELHVVEAGDHSLAVTKTYTKQTGDHQEDVDERILGAVAAFLGRVTGGGG